MKRVWQGDFRLRRMVPGAAVSRGLPTGVPCAPHLYQRDVRRAGTPLRLKSISQSTDNIIRVSGAQHSDYTFCICHERPVSRDLCSLAALRNASTERVQGTWCLSPHTVTSPVQARERPERPRCPARCFIYDLRPPRSRCGFLCFTGVRTGAGG